MSSKSRVVTRLLSVCGVAAMTLGSGLVPPAAASPAEPVLGELVTIAGNGETGYSGDGQLAVDARLGSALHIDAGPDGVVYIADRDSGRVRKVDTRGRISTVPGTRALRSPANDGPEVNGWQYSPSDKPDAVAAAPDGSIYVAGREALRRVDRNGRAKRIADLGDNDVLRFDLRHDIAVDAKGAVYLTGQRAHQVYRVDRRGKVTVFADREVMDAEPIRDPDSASSRPIYGRLHVATDSAGNVLVADPSRASLWRITPAGEATRLVGARGEGYSGDGGPAVRAQLGTNLDGVAVDGDDNIYLADVENDAIRRIDTEGVITTVASAADDSGSIGDITVSADGKIYGTSKSQVKRVGTAHLERIKPGRASRWSPVADAEPGTVRTIAGDGSEWPETNPVIEQATVEQWGRGDLGPDGAFYLAEPGEHRVYKYAPDGTRTVVAGSGTAGSGGDGGTATKARLDAPRGVVVGPDGELFIADSGAKRVRRVSPNGKISTYAGNGRAGKPGGYFGEEVAVSGDGGPATKATVTPSDVALDGDGNLYISEGANKRISKVAPDGTISTHAGGGERWKDDADGHPATEASLYHPASLAAAKDGTVYFVENYGDWSAPSVRVIRPDGVLDTLAGDSYRDPEEGGFGGDGGPATKAELNNPRDVAVGPDGRIVIADTNNARLRSVGPDGRIVTIAGTGKPAATGDGGPARKAGLDEPRSVDVGPDGRIVTVGSEGGNIRMISDGTISTMHRPDADKPRGAVRATRTTVANATSLSVDPSGALHFVDRSGLQGGVAKVGRNGMLSWAETADSMVATAVSAGPGGSLYTSDGRRVWRTPEDGDPVVVAGSRAVDRKIRDGQVATATSLTPIHQLKVSPDGVLYIAGGAGVVRVEDDGTISTVVTRSRSMDTAYNVAPARDGVVYVSDDKKHRVYRYDPDGQKTVVAGNGSDTVYDEDNGDGGDATEAVVRSVSDIAVAEDGTLYLSNFDGIRRVDTDGVIETVYDNPYDKGEENATTSITSLALNANGDLYFSQPGWQRVQVLVQPGEISGGFPWTTVLWIAAAAAVLGAGYAWYRRRSAVPA